MLNRTMITASNSLGQIQQALDVVSSNVANVDTNGYKRQVSNFSSLLYQNVNNQKNEGAEVGRLTPHGIRLGVGAKVSQVQTQSTQGALITTTRPLDIAFGKENQFLKVLAQDEFSSDVRYTRNGAMYVSPITDGLAEGEIPNVMLTNASGYPILDENENMIIIPGDFKDFTFTPSGEMVVEMNDGSSQSINLGIVEVQKPQFLQSYGENLVGLPQNMDALNVNQEEILTEMTGELREQISVNQGMLEKSNVSMADEMSELIKLQRSYQFQSRAVSIADQMLGLINGLR